MFKQRENKRSQSRWTIRKMSEKQRKKKITERWLVNEKYNKTKSNKKKSKMSFYETMLNRHY